LDIHDSHFTSGTATPSEDMVKSPVGFRNMQESTLDKEPAEAKTTVRVRQPPG